MTLNNQAHDLLIELIMKNYEESECLEVINQYLNEMYRRGYNDAQLHERRMIHVMENEQATMIV